MKTLKEYLIEYSEQHNYDTSDKGLAETLMECFPVVCKDNEDEHRWYTNWLYIYKVAIDDQDRFFAITLPVMKTEDGCWDDIGFEFNVDNAKEVFPKQVMKTVYL